MTQDNKLASDISNAGDKAALDAACKRLLANKIILAWILKDCIEEYKECSVNDIVDKYIEGEPQISAVPVNPDETNRIIKGAATEDVTQTEGTVTYDIRFYAVAPVSDELIRLIINIETQNNFYPGYPLPKRGVYYCSRMISAQKETEFVNSHYEDIKKVYSIWICTNPPSDRENSITSYSFTEKNIVGSVREDVRNYDLMTVIMICLGSAEKEKHSSVLRLLDVLLTSETKPDEKKHILQNDFEIEMTQTMEVSIMCNYSDYIEERGIKKGLEQGVLESIRNLMNKMSITVDNAMDLVGVPESEYEKYKNMLKELA